MVLHGLPSLAEGVVGVEERVACAPSVQPLAMRAVHTRAVPTASARRRDVRAEKEEEVTLPVSGRWHATLHGQPSKGKRGRPGLVSAVGHAVERECAAASLP